MFDTKDPDSYYSEAVKDAVINREKNSNKTILLIVNLSFLTIASIFGFKYFNNNHTKVETNVLGVTYQKEKSQKESSNIDFTSEIEKIDKETSDNEYSSQLEKYISQEMEQAKDTIESVDDNPKPKSSKKEKEIVIVVKKGDTLASLAKKYYNDPKAYDLIIENNREIFKNSHTIYPGQELKISQRY